MSSSRVKGLIKKQDMRTNVRTGLQLHAFLTSVQHGIKWSSSHRNGTLDLASGKEPTTLKKQEYQDFFDSWMTISVQRRICDSN